MTHRAVVILAAGASTRLGQPKAGLVCAGKTLLQRAIDTAAGTGAVVWVTRRSGTNVGTEGQGRTPDVPGEILGPARMPDRLLDVPDAHEGMSASLRIAAQAAIDSPQIDQLAVLLVDQHAVDVPWLNTLFDLSARFPDRFVASVHEGRRGAPAVFPRSRFAELRALAGDAGARHLLRAAPAETIVEWPAPWAPGDVDTVEDLATLAVAAPARNPRR